MIELKNLNLKLGNWPELFAIGLLLICFFLFSIEFISPQSGVAISRRLSMRTTQVTETTACANQDPSPIWIDVTMLKPRNIGARKYLVLQPNVCIKLGKVKTHIIWNFANVGQGRKELSSSANIVRISTYNLAEIPRVFFKKSLNGNGWRRAIRRARRRLRNRNFMMNGATDFGNLKDNSKERWSVVFYETPRMSRAEVKSLMPDQLSFAQRISSAESEKLMRTGASIIDLSGSTISFESLPRDKDAKIIFRIGSENLNHQLKTIAEASRLGWHQLYWAPPDVEEK